ncbi:uncharacterized protein LOC114648469 [Erpetoichthys calabaricus]|uniref:uncharacterized protein LOC114648469 n=1 Tax=Erpetoichthys calabaricus TaxID=27687 RepID=UPI00223498B3|nr:uncharacterized protein LOC114648469 [Erpetoichthys calabaricus]
MCHSLCTFETVDMLQQNNNNNYLCFEAGLSRRKIILASCSRGSGGKGGGGGGGGGDGSTHHRDNPLQAVFKNSFGFQYQAHKIKAFRSKGGNNIYNNGKNKTGAQKKQRQPCLSAPDRITTGKTGSVSDSLAKVPANQKISISKSQEGENGTSLRTDLGVWRRTGNANQTGSAVTIATLQTSALSQLQSGKTEENSRLHSKDGYEHMTGKEDSRTVVSPTSVLTLEKERGDGLPETKGTLSELRRNAEISPKDNKAGTEKLKPDLHPSGNVDMNELDVTCDVLQNNKMHFEGRRWADTSGSPTDDLYNAVKSEIEGSACPEGICYQCDKGSAPDPEEMTDKTIHASQLHVEAEMASAVQRKTSKEGGQMRSKAEEPTSKLVELWTHTGMIREAAEKHIEDHQSTDRQSWTEKACVSPVGTKQCPETCCSLTPHCKAGNQIAVPTSSGGAKLSDVIAKDIIEPGEAKSKTGWQAIFNQFTTTEQSVEEKTSIAAVPNDSHCFAPAWKGSLTREGPAEFISGARGEVPDAASAQEQHDEGTHTDFLSVSLQNQSFDGPTAAPLNLAGHVTMATLPSQKDLPTEVKGHVALGTELEISNQGSSWSNDGVSPSIDLSEEDDEFGLFEKAGNRQHWDECFAEFNQMPYGKKSDDVPVNSSANLEESWTAFSCEDGSESWNSDKWTQQQTDDHGQWWATSAVEDSWKQSKDLSSLFQGCFPPVSPQSADPEEVFPLHHTLNRRSQKESKDENRQEVQLWECLQEIHEATGLKHKWAGSVAQKVLQHSLHILPVSKENETQSQPSGCSPPHHLKTSYQQSPCEWQTWAKAAFDINRNLLA